MSAFRVEELTKHLNGMKIAQNRVLASVYHLTKDRGILNDNERSFYEKNGYLIIKRLVEKSVLEDCRKHFHNICNGKVDRKGMTLMADVSQMFSSTRNQVYTKIEDFLDDSTFLKYAEYADLLNYVQSIIGPNLMVMHSMLINKAPGTSIYPPHQDLHYINYGPAKKVVASWTAIDPVFKDNGCLYVVPGSHLQGLYPHSQCEGEVKTHCSGIDNYDKIISEDLRVYLSMDQGDTILFHPLLIHGSGPNTTNNFRKAISCHYASSDSKFTKTNSNDQNNNVQKNDGFGQSSSGMGSNVTQKAKHLRGYQKSYL